MEEQEITLQKIDKLAENIAKGIGAPILIMYYDLDERIITDKDVRVLYDTCRSSGAKREMPYKILYVLLHTYGGEADASYRLAQVIHDFAEDVIFLVPYHALSGGTLICLSGNKLILGAYATLSPIDITVDNTELTSIAQFRDFAVDTREEIENMFSTLKDNRNESFATDVESTMMSKMVEQVTALEIGSLYRRSKLTTDYASKLMKDYMFRRIRT